MACRVLTEQRWLGRMRKVSCFVVVSSLGNHRRRATIFLSPKRADNITRRRLSFWWKTHIGNGWTGNHFGRQACLISDSECFSIFMLIFAHVEFAIFRDHWERSTTSLSRVRCVHITVARSEFDSCDGCGELKQHFRFSSSCFFFPFFFLAFSVAWYSYRLWLRCKFPNNRSISTW